MKADDTAVPALVNRGTAVVLVLLVAMLFTAGGGLWWSGVLYDVVSFKAIGLNFEALQGHVARHRELAMAGYVLCYGLLGMLLLPGSAIFVVASGLLFGSSAGIPLALAGSLLAASAAFLISRTVLAGLILRRPKPWLDRLRAGFNRHALSYMMFLRLTPGLPFGAINVGPALIGVPFVTFFAGTAIGLVPSRIALSTAGAGLAAVVGRQNALYSQCLAAAQGTPHSCRYDIEVASLLTGETVAAFVALAGLALVPALLDAAPGWRRLLWSKRDADV